MVRTSYLGLQAEAPVRVWFPYQAQVRVRVWDWKKDLMKIIPQDRWIQFSHQLIHHGRGPCVARKPKCGECNMTQICYAADRT